MDYLRDSSQPATVDLVRADLAEVWTIDHPQPGIPKAPASILDASDLDLEPAETPKFRPSKARKSDALTDMLAGVLDPTPKRIKEPEDHQKAVHTGKGPPEAADNDDAFNHERCAGSDDFQPDQDIDPRRLFEPAPSADNTAESPNPRGRRGRSSRKELPKADSGDRDRPNQQSVVVESPVISDDTKRRRGQRSNNKLVAPSTAGKGPTKPSQQAILLTEAPDPLPTRVKTKGRKRNDDDFDLSDSTDIETVPRPKKRQTKGSAPMKSRVVPKKSPRVTNTEVDLSTQRRRNPRLPKKPVGIQLLETYNEEAQQGDRKPPLDAGQTRELRIDPGRPHSNTSSPDHQDTNRGWQMGLKPLESPSAKSSPAPAFSGPPKPSPTLPRVNEPVLPKQSKPEVIVLLSDNGEAADDAPRSTSPLFLEQDQEYTFVNNVSDSPVASKSGIYPEPRWPAPKITELEMIPRSQLIPPPTFQPRSLSSAADMLPKYAMKHPLPGGKVNSIPAERPGLESPFPAHGVDDSEDRLSPEDMWKQAVEDSSPPAVLHKIVALLHRSLKPREEVVRDIANDYQENALRLLENLSARHVQEKVDTLTALRNASDAAFSVFSGAGHDMRILSGRLRDLNVAGTDTTLRRPALTQKLDVVARLCETKLTSKIQDGLEPPVDDSASEPEMAKTRSDGLVKTYRLRLCGTIREQGDEAFEEYNRMNAEVDSFITRCIQGESESKKTSQPEVKKTDTSNQTADEALEAFLDKMIGNLQERVNGRGLPQLARGMDNQIIDVFDESIGVSEMDVSC